MVFLKGFALGMMLQLSVGPVFFAVFYKSISEGFREAFKMTIAVALVDAAYIVVSFTSVAALLEIQAVHMLVRGLGSAVLAYFGLKYIKGAKADRNMESRGDAGKGGSFMYGMKLTILNPLTILFWSATFGSLISSGRLSGIGSTAIFSLGCVLSTVVFLGAMSLLGNRISRMLNGRILKMLDYSVGVFLLCFSARLMLAG
ncbi:lysine exporter protein (plasmid) [Peptoclostridium acidaminophilum DSM 3953]|uniref:Lysine exporter protein n=1 Tax=Peptoclostridium acidaminophilum DSM 3953 TaxID=1286171 RepID=W8TBR3_PEPAC|nr:LysE family transporter [Peptoclostridium acidaminophilum]AHM58270.1 lysine exporter protein [Peptoclostridium acidaminophilum DSM 3953]